MRVLAQRYDVLACLKLVARKAVAVLIVAVVGRYIRKSKGKSQGLALAGTKHNGLVKRNEVDSRFLNTAVGVRGSCIKLYDLFTLLLANVGYGNIDRNYRGCGKNRIGRCELINGPFKVGVGKTVTEGILYDSIVARLGNSFAAATL